MLMGKKNIYMQNIDAKINLTKNATTLKSHYKRYIKIYASWQTGSPGFYEMLP
jgi:hypothetical protein